MKPSESQDVMCYVCQYYADWLGDDSGASVKRRSAVARELHRHERMYHPERYGKGLRVPR